MNHQYAAAYHCQSQPLLDVRTFAQSISQHPNMWSQPATPCSSTSSKPSAKPRPKSYTVIEKAKKKGDGRLGYPAPVSVQRRNERERNRVKQVNQGFATLRVHVSGDGVKNKKMSKVETLKNAIEYIRKMQELLSEQDPNFAEQLRQSMSAARDIKMELDNADEDNESNSANAHSFDHFSNTSEYPLSVGNPSTPQETSPHFLKNEDDFSWYDSHFLGQ